VDLFDGWRIAQLARHYEEILTAMVANLDQTVGDVPLMDRTARQQLLKQWSDLADPAEVCYPSHMDANGEPAAAVPSSTGAGPHPRRGTREDERTVPDLFEHQVAATPDRVAVIQGDCAITYRELNERSNRLARVLVQEGAGPERLLAVACHRSVDMVMALVAVLKTGAAYLPVDLADPVVRV
jgi:non-ribosomal peptide synthetase component F